ncbi:hypothetical protein [Candidatus Korobacter versatilis]|uniref:hypothetical protein n=1 Tax=Candidatus Korobacter versatilis TaxID=658062 RepID=UPI0011D16AD3|nr:hypothetical protein [Candidatus Koribacter versatilis]
MHLEHHHSCNAPIPHHVHGGDWTSVCPNPIGAKCYKCDRFYCDDHIRKHDCDGNDDHPASD